VFNISIEKNCENLKKQKNHLKREVKHHPNIVFLFKALFLHLFEIGNEKFHEKKRKKLFLEIASLTFSFLKILRSSGLLFTPLLR
jgi:hypothetical protein